VAVRTWVIARTLGHFSVGMYFTVILNMFVNYAAIIMVILLQTLRKKHDAIAKQQ